LDLEVGIVFIEWAKIPRGPRLFILRKFTESDRMLSFPPYQYCRSMVQVLSFPETANGKLDRKALPDPTQKDLCNYSHTEGEGGNGDASGRSSGDTLSSEPSVRSEEFPGNLGVTSPEMADREMEKESHNGHRDGQNLNLHHKAVTAMARHICDTIEKLRGRRPAFSSSFASIGVDSLGAVMFIKYLSDSLGGIRIEPAKIYAAGITIKSFAEALLIRLEREKPEALLFLGVSLWILSLHSTSLSSTLSV
jgi:Phosphopantetheine attachment site